MYIAPKWLQNILKCEINNSNGDIDCKEEC